MFNVRLAGYLYGKQLFTWLSLVVSLMAPFVLSFFPLDVLDEIWDLIGSVSEGFRTYFYTFIVVAKVKGLRYMSSRELMIILLLLLLKSGDAEQNIDPELSDYSSSFSSLFSSSNTILPEHVSLVHYKIQSLLNKVDILESLDCAL